MRTRRWSTGKDTLDTTLINRDPYSYTQVIPTKNTATFHPVISIVVSAILTSLVAVIAYFLIVNAPPVFANHLMSLVLFLEIIITSYFSFLNMMNRKMKV